MKQWEEIEQFDISNDDPIIEEWQSMKCPYCGLYLTTPSYAHTIKKYDYCPSCGKRIGAEETNHD